MMQLGVFDKENQSEKLSELGDLAFLHMTFNEEKRRAAENITINNYIGHIENSNFHQGKTNNMNISYDGDKQKAILMLSEGIEGILSEIKDDKSHEEISADIATID